MLASRLPRTVLPAKLTSLAVKPLTGSLKTTVKRIGEALVGSGCPAAWLMVTVGGTLSKVTVRSVLVEAALGLPARSVAAPAGVLTSNVGGAVGAGRESGEVGPGPGD